MACPPRVRPRPAAIEVDEDTTLSDVSLIHLDWLWGEYPSFKWEATARWYPGDAYWSVPAQHRRALKDWPATRKFMSASPVRALRLSQGLEDPCFDPFSCAEEQVPQPSLK